MIDEKYLTNEYNVIYIDPPWSYYNDMSVDYGVTTVRGVRRPPYSVLSTDDIKALPINKVAADDCFMFIWTTDYHLYKCLQIIEHWGFEYKTIGFAWQKLNNKNEPVTFTGAYTLKSGIELCLLATKGNPKKFLKSRKVRALVTEKRGRHSEKPIEVRRRIDELVGDVPKIEIFARTRHPNWDAWGNELDVDLT